MAIIASYTLGEFVKQFGTMKNCKFTNSETQEEFTRPGCVNKDGKLTLLYFSKTLGKLSPKEIVAMQKDLQICTLDALDKQGNHICCFCKKGQYEAWEDIPIDLD